MSVHFSNTTSEIQIKHCQKEENESWDEFVSQIHGANFQQTSIWAQTCKTNNFCSDYLRIILYKNDRIIGGTQILIRLYGKHIKTGIIEQGPCFIEDPGAEIIGLLIEQIKQTVRKRKLIYLTIDTFSFASYLPSYLKKSGFKKSIRILPPQPIIESTLILDLTQTEEELLKQFDSRRRRHITAGMKFEYDTREATHLEEVKVFHRLMTDACKRRRTRPVYSNLSIFENIWKEFFPKKWLSLHIAEKNNLPVCALWGYSFGDTFRSEIWGWNGDYSKEKISETFLWKNMLLAKEKGFKYYDCVQLDPLSYKAILSNKEVPEAIKNRGLFWATYFKLRWGGTIIDYPGFYTYYRNWFVWIAMILASKVITLNKQFKRLKKRKFKTGWRVH